MAKTPFQAAQDRLSLRRNDAEECWELLMLRAHSAGDDALIARFYDGDRRYSPIGEMVYAVLKTPEVDA